MRDKKIKNNVQKIRFQMFGMFLLRYLDGHLSSCASCPFKGGGLKESYGELSVLFLFFFSFLFPLRWSVCPLFLQERITGLHFSFSSSVSRLRQQRSEGQL